MRFFFLILFFVTTAVHAYELVVIQAVSETKRTFVTRNGKRQGIQPGMTGTFTADNASFLAKAMTVTGQFTQWELITPDAQFPYPKGAVLTYYPATEYIWALAPEEARKKYIKRYVGVKRQSWIFKGALSRGLSDSVSEAPAETHKRGGFMGEVFYEKDLLNRLSFDVGLRYEKETINYASASFVTTRNLLIADLIYYFETIEDIIHGRVYVGIGAGYGLSHTSTVDLEQSGNVSLLPSAKLGISLPFSEEYEFLGESAFESLQTREEQEGGNLQTTTQTNLKISFGLRKFF